MLPFRIKKNFISSFNIALGVNFLVCCHSKTSFLNSSKWLLMIGLNFMQPKWFLHLRFFTTITSFIESKLVFIKSKTLKCTFGQGRLFKIDWLWSFKGDWTQWTASNVDLWNSWVFGTGGHQKRRPWKTCRLVVPWVHYLWNVDWLPSF